jgi:hypothetical protein
MSWLHHANHSPFMQSLDHVREEPESEVQAEQARAEVPTNLALDQGKPDALQPMTIVFLFGSLLYCSCLIGH